MKTIVILTTILGLAVAQRETSLSVIDSLRQVQPAYRELQNYVVAAVANAKLNSSDVIYDFHGEIFVAKDNFLRSAVNLEANTLRHIDGQSSETDSSCLGFLRSSIDVNINLAGVSFTNCINVVDTKLKAEIDQVYSHLELNETSFLDISLYDVFRGQNIFVNPQAIIDLLQAKLGQLQQSPTGLIAELSALVDDFRARLDVIRGSYRQCLTVNDQLLQTTINTILIQLQQICMGVLLPNVETTAATNATPDQPPSPAPEESFWNFARKH
ncbi:uncharacterized protein LOC129727463 [Wyeomyia smithii]|uniref:uncharacterized protein LOC129727463 n=1 Tax=Wyeomyia smithii TaxID=174621 RepID=UPI002467C8B7|nr:uncharacterized protein LOC129727463 [Wyeomyia smithii]